MIIKITQDATVTAFKKLTAKHWQMMKDADIKMVVQLIRDVSSVYLHQVLTEGGIDVVEAAQEVCHPENSSDPTQEMEM